MRASGLTVGNLAFAAKLTFPSTAPVDDVGTLCVKANPLVIDQRPQKTYPISTFLKMRGISPFHRIAAEREVMPAGRLEFDQVQRYRSSVEISQVSIVKSVLAVRLTALFEGREEGVFGARSVSVFVCFNTLAPGTRDDGGCTLVSVFR